MKRCLFFILLIFWGRSVLLAQMSDLERAFLLEYGITPVSPCVNEEMPERSGGSGCHNIALRGKAFAPFFVPKEDSPIMTVRLNLIFIQKDDGTGNFQENNVEHQEFIDDVITDLNRRISSLVMPGTECFLGTEDEMIHDIRIRFVDRRFYVKKSAVWNNNLYYNDSNLCPNSNWYLAGVNDSLNNTLDDTEKAINVYFTEDATQYHHFWEIQNTNDTLDFDGAYTKIACSLTPSYYDWQYSSQIQMPCQYSKYWFMKYIVPQLGRYGYPSWENQVRNWHIETISGTLAHEIGHSFYLLHQKRETANSTFYPDSCGASIMDPSGASPHNFLHPLEIGRMYFSAMTTNVQQYIPSDTYLGTIRIDSTLSLPSMRMYYSLIIGPSVNVNIPCDMIFSYPCNIQIENGGVLSINDASLQSVDVTWGGIIVQNGGQLVLSDVNINDYDITVNAGGCLIIRNDLSISGNHSIRINDGGFLCIDSDASISLLDRFSTIEVLPNAILGCPACNDDCLLTKAALTHSGDGSILFYEGTEYLQNVNISNDTIVNGYSVLAGYDVTTLKPVGNVIVNSGGKLKIKAINATLEPGVEVKLGGEMLISQ